MPPKTGKSRFAHLQKVSKTGQKPLCPFGIKTLFGAFERIKPLFFACFWSKFTPEKPGKIF